jgi:hypothetical protein
MYLIAKILAIIIIFVLNITIMSLQKGNTKKGAQKYQNTFKFHHNKNSVKTEKIKNSPLDNLCQRCYDIIKWKIEYRKYKPLSAASKCNVCRYPNIIKAYRTICDPCSHLPHPVTGERPRLCTKCGKDTLIGEDGEEGTGYAEFTPNASAMQQEQEREDQEVEMLLGKLRER